MNITKERPTLNECITEMVRLLATRNHMKQTDIARALHVDKAVVTRAFQGQRDWKASEVDQLAVLFNVDRDLLLSDPEDRLPAGGNSILQSAHAEYSPEECVLYMVHAA